MYSLLSKYQKKTKRWRFANHTVDSAINNFSLAAKNCTKLLS